MPSWSRVSRSAPSRVYAWPKYFSNSGKGNTSVPAVKGVCVVKTELSRTLANACSNFMPFSTSIRIRSKKGQAGMTFVDVDPGRHDSKRLENAHPADSQNDLLPKPLLGLRNVETIGDRPCPRADCFQCRCRAGRQGFRPMSAFQTRT